MYISVNKRDTIVKTNKCMLDRWSIPFISKGCTLVTLKCPVIGKTKTFKKSFGQQLTNLKL